ncbi:MAG TPA: DUF433 domain-containing protein [Trueperaceae bacterium]|nr:DUF433 domain-containing protein [Trueperaceae bacterium]
MPERLREAIEVEAVRRGRSRSYIATELLDEALRMRHAPGIVVVDGATGRRAVVAGTGVDVWEVAASWRAAEGDLSAVIADFSWLTPMQVKAALGYYQLYPEEIDLRLQAEEAWTPERVKRELPFLTPHRSEH